MNRLFMWANYTVLAYGATAFYLASGDFLFLFLIANLLVVGGVLGFFFPLYLPKKVSNFLVVILFVVFWVDFTNQEFMLFLAKFLILVQLLRIFYFRRVLYDLPKDSTSSGEYFQLYFITMVEFAVASISSVSLFFGLLFFAFLLLSPTLLLIYTLQGERERHHLEKFPFPKRWLFVLSLSMGVVISLFSALFFLFIPRVSMGILKGGPIKKTHITGFSDQVNLDDMAYILENPQVVMRLKLLTPLPPSVPLLLKGSAYEVYQDRQWKHRGGFYRAKIQKGLCKLPGFISGPKGRPLVQEITLNPLTTPTLFALHPPGQVQFSQTIPFPYLWVYYNGRIKTPYILSKPLKYKVTSFYHPHSISRLKQATSSETNPLYMRLPMNLHVGKIRQKAYKIIANRYDLSPYETAVKISNYLKNNYVYTLDLSDTDQEQDPVEEFLFTKKKGHCELFASSMIFLLRSLRIPSRLVNGFRAHEYNSLGKYYLVRQKDAHAWVEVFFDEIGWIPFDPTAPRQPSSRGAIKTRFQHLMDYLRVKWMNRVVQYDGRTQKALLRRGGNLVARLPSLLPRWPSWLGWWIFGLGPFVLVGGFLSMRKRRMNSLQVRYSLILQGILKILHREGYTLLSWETPLELIRRAVAHQEKYAPLEKAIWLYYQGRYSQHPLREEEIQKIHNLLLAWEEAESGQ